MHEKTLFFDDAPFCIHCYTPGHARLDCPNEPVTWTTYVNSLKETGIPSALFEPIDASLNQSNVSNQSNLTSTPRVGQDSAIRAELRALLQEAISSQNNQVVAAPPVAPPVQPVQPVVPVVPVINPTPRLRSQRSLEANAPLLDPNPPQAPVLAVVRPRGGRGGRGGRGRGRGARGGVHNNSAPDYLQQAPLRPRGRGAQYSYWAPRRN